MKHISLFFCILSLSLGLFACSKRNLAKISQRDSDAQAIHKCLKLSEKKRFEEAVECLQIFKSHFPNSTYAQEAEIKIADNYYRKKEYLLAAETYKVFVQTNPGSDKLDYAYYRMGLCYEKEMPKKIDRDQSHLQEAKRSFTTVVQLFPNSSYAYMAKAKHNQMRKRDAQRHFYVGSFYYRTGEYRASIPRFRQVVNEYSDLPIGRDALYYLAMAYAKLEHQETAKELAKLFIQKYPLNKFGKKLTKKLLGDDHG